MRIGSLVVLAALGVFGFASPAHADDSLEGTSCETSDECPTSLKCIDEHCRDVGAIMRGERPERWGGTYGHVAMFGNGEGYGKAVAIADIVATITEPFLMVATVSSSAPASSILGVVCFVPTAFAGSTVHLVNGRPLPAVISFFAWTSLAGSTFVVGGLFGLAFERGFEFNSVAAWTAGLLFGGAGAAALTWLDVFMARQVAVPEKRKSLGVSFTPSIIPTRGGAMASLGGSW